MTDYLPLFAAALVGVLVPASVRWLWSKIEQPLSSIGERITAIEDKQTAQGLDIAFLKGVQSERAQTAQAAIVAAALVTHPLEEPHHSSAG